MNVDWRPDVLGGDYRQAVLEFGADPDGETPVAAVLVRHEPGVPEHSGAVLYVHGFSDYFFQTGLAEFCHDRGLAFYALDTRKSGRARRDGQTPHYVSDLALYDQDLDTALDIIAEEHPGEPVVVMAHSTGGLITPLWLDRRRRAGRDSTVRGLVLNSPWFDLQGKPFLREVVTPALRVLARAQPFRPVSLPPGPYGRTLHTSGTGEFDFDLELKPLDGFPVTLGWLNAVRRGQAVLHRGLHVGAPSLILRSARTHYSSRYTEASDRADLVLDVDQIARWAGCLGEETTIVPIDGARHDVFLSALDPRDEAYRRLGRWLAEHELGKAVAVT